MSSLPARRDALPARRNEDAERAFMARMADVTALLDRLRACADDHLGAPAEAIHWGHVGTASEAQRGLEELAAFLRA